MLERAGPGEPGDLGGTSGPEWCRTESRVDTEDCVTPIGQTLKFRYLRVKGFWGRVPTTYRSEGACSGRPFRRTLSVSVGPRAPTVPETLPEGSPIKSGVLLK